MASTEYPLHESVFNNDIQQVSKLIRTCDVSQKDCHGNTPLHLAVMLGHKEVIHLLLAHGAPVKVKNAAGWTPLAEAISYGHRNTILVLLRRLKLQSRQALEERRPLIVSALADIGDFDLQLKWDFHSWVPLVSRILPSDICRIRKKGPQIRLDTTLVDFSEMKWERGDVSFIFNGEASPNQSMTVLDNKLKVYQKVRYEDTDMELEEEVDILMSSDIVAAQMSTKKISFSRSQSGWLYRHDKSENIGDFRADFYAVNNLVLESKKRREHLSSDDIQRNRAIIDNLSRGTAIENGDAAANGPPRRASLAPPPPSAVSWADYCAAAAPPTLARTVAAKESAKTFKATVAMSDEFPMTAKVLLDVLEVMVPFKHFQKLRDFMNSRLPPGFPVRIEIPVFPTITAKVTFTSFSWEDKLDQALFTTPLGYKEDPSRFPDF